MNELQQRIIDIAKGYQGQREKGGNSGFVDATFEKKMKAMGWKKPWAWCAFFVKLVWIEAYNNPKRTTLLNKLFSPAAVGTMRAFELAGYQRMTHPVPGALVVWQQAEPSKSWMGHIGVVVQVGADGTFWSMEGNTNQEGGREGVEVALQHRRMDTLTKRKATGKNLIGFIHPI